MIPYHQILTLLKHGQLLDGNLVPGILVGKGATKKKGATAGAAAGTAAGIYTDAFFIPADVETDSALDESSEMQAYVAMATVCASNSRKKTQAKKVASTVATSVELLGDHLALLRACATVNTVKLPESLAKDAMPLVATVAKVVAEAASNQLLSANHCQTAEDVAAFLVERISAITPLAEGKCSGVHLVPRSIDGRR